MTRKPRYSIDPKVKLISIEQFLEENDYLRGITKKDLWKENKRPKMEETYYKFTPSLLICVIYGYSFTNFGMEIKENLETIKVAYRDGKTEYELFDKKINLLKEERSRHKRSKKLDEKIFILEKARKLLPKRKETIMPETKPFESYIYDTGYKTSNERLKNRYLVFDVETNGIRTSKDDLLSLSIYDPTSGICYNRFFPLDLQPLILTGFIHGITDETITGTTHLTQNELDWLIDFFHIRERVLLSFSGGKGSFDSLFVQNYCKRHNIIGFEDLQFENIKSRLPKAPFGAKGQLTKDNLCRIFGIDGINEFHSSYNDCILEWRLFEKLESECVFFIDEQLYKYTPEYIIPYTYLFKHPELVQYANINIPHIKGTATEIYNMRFPKKLLKDIKKFPTNITGITIEHGINAYLHAEKQDNIMFLAENKLQLKYIGSLNSTIKEIPIITEDDGTIKAIKEEDAELIEQINEVTEKIVECIKPVADYLKTTVFKDKKIMTQELSISDDRKVLALCDLSDSKNIVEIKTCDVLDEDNNLKTIIARQLYFQAKGRNIYLLSIKFDTHFNKRLLKEFVDNLNIILYKIQLSEYDPSTIIKERTLSEIEITILKEIINNPSIPKTRLATIFNLFPEEIGYIIKNLETFGYLKKKNPASKRTTWIVLRSIDDTITKYTEVDDFINIIDD